MTKTQAKEELRRAHLAATGSTLDPAFQAALAAELALYYSPGPFGQPLTDQEADERQNARLLALTETSINGQD